MGVSIRIDTERGFVDCRYEGQVDERDIRDAWIRVYGDAAWTPGMPELIDYTGAERIIRSSRAAAALADYCRRLFEAHGVTETRTAVVAPTPLARGVARMYTTYTEDSAESPSIFDDRARALAHLFES